MAGIEKHPETNFVELYRDISASEYMEFKLNNPTSNFNGKCASLLLRRAPVAANGLRVLDYGSGASLHETVLTAAKASEIVLSDYSPKNREALRLWLNGDPAAFDWIPHFRRTLREIEEGGEKELSHRVETIRRVAKAVVHCDLSQDPPIQRGYDVQYDLIYSSFCLCAAANSHEEYRQGINKLAKLLKPGGVLMMYESEHKECQQSFYYIKSSKFPYVAVTSEFVAGAFRDAGFVAVSVRSVEMDPNHSFRVQRLKELGTFTFKASKHDVSMFITSGMCLSATETGLNLYTNL